MSEENTSHITIDSYMHNAPTLPPHYEQGLTFRYFVDLSEYYAKGLTAENITVSIHYAPNNAKLSKLLPWDESKHIYYVEASWPNTDLYGKTEVKFDLANYTANCMDTANDFSRSGLVKTLAMTEYIPIYKDGVKLYGKEPPKAGTQSKTGDVNGDSTIDALDLALMKSYLLGKINDFPVENDLEVADVNGDSSIDVIDFSLMRRYILGIITGFPK